MWPDIFGASRRMATEFKIPVRHATSPVIREKGTLQRDSWPQPKVEQCVDYRFLLAPTKSVLLFTG